nr:hypothetical protein [Cytophagales bacterium]
MTLQNIIEKNIIATAVLAVFALLPAAAQHKYWVVFKDKPTAHAACVSPEAVRNRLAQGLPASQTTDWPVNETYVNRLRTTGGQVHTVSKWLNAAAATLDENQLAAVRKLPFVQEVTPIDARIRIAATA